MKDQRLAVLIDADNVPYSNIKEMLEEWKDKNSFRPRFFELSKKYSWQNEEKVLLEIVRKASEENRL